MKRKIITITGFPGSGKSSTAKAVASALGYEHFSSGDLYRKMATARGLTIEELNFLAEKQKEIDLEVDEFLKKIAREKKNIVIDSRMAFHWMPDSFKVFLKLDARTAAQRAFAQIQRVGRVGQDGSSVDEVLENTLKRRKSEQKRYSDLYGVDITDQSQFDLVVDTAKYDLSEVSRIIIAAYKKWLNIPSKK